MKRIIFSASSIIILLLMFTSCSNLVKSSLSIPDYISDYDAQFNETEQQLLVTFGLKSADKQYISSSGTAEITVTDNTGNKLFDDTISFDEKDFSDYTSKLWSGTRYLCGIYIDADKITPAASDEGIVELTVRTADDQAVFDPQKMDVFGLPTKDIDITMPNFPVKVSYIDFDNKESVLNITDASVKTDILIDDASVEIKATVKVISNGAKSSQDDYTVKCVLKDSKGVIMSSEEEYFEHLDEGESAKVVFDFYELDPNETYKLSFKGVDDSFDY